MRTDASIKLDLFGVGLFNRQLDPFVFDSLSVRSISYVLEVLGVFHLSP